VKKHPQLPFYQAGYDFSAPLHYSPQRPYFVWYGTPGPRLTTAHFHSGCELGVCLNDNMRMYYNGVYYDLQKHDAYFLDATFPHGHENGTLVECEVKVSSLVSASPVKGDMRLYRPFVELRAGLTPVIKKALTIQKHLEAVYALSLSNDQEWALWGWPHIVAAFTAVARATLPALVRSSARVNPKTPAAVFIALQFINDHYRENITIAQMAKACCLSPSRFSHLFSLCMQSSPIDYRNHLRLSDAIVIILSSSEKVERIGAECGFNSFSQFALLFKKLTGFSPTVLRQQNRTPQ
jgi:AraC-like DNA-binding protein